MAEWKRAGDVETFHSKVPKVQPPPLPYSGPPAAPYMAPREYAYLIPDRPKSPLSRVAGGVLNLFLPGVGRMYLGYVGIGILQLVATIASCGILSFWPFIDGILILVGSVREDGMGRALES